MNIDPKALQEARDLAFAWDGRFDNLIHLRLQMDTLEMTESDMDALSVAAPALFESILSLAGEDAGVLSTAREIIDLLLSVDNPEERQ